MRRRDALARVERLEQFAAPVAASPAAEAWRAAHGWQPAGFCHCASLASLGAPLAPCGGCPRAGRPVDSPLARAVFSPQEDPRDALP